MLFGSDEHIWPKFTWIIIIIIEDIISIEGITNS